MKTSVEEISSVRKKVTIEIEAEEVGNRINEAYKDLGKKAKVHGFRPGKAPRKILEKYFGDQIKEDVSKTLMTESLPAAFEEIKIYPLTLPAVEKTGLKPGESFRFSTTVEVKPVFELKDYMGLEVEKEIFSVSKVDVENRLEEIRKASGQLKPIEEARGAREEDCVIITYQGFEGEKQSEGVKGEDSLVKLGSHEFHPDFEKGLIGLKIGDSAEITVDFADSYEDARLAGKKITFRVKVNDLKRMELPPLDDDFAKSLGADFIDLETLKGKIREDISEREEKRIQKEFQRRLMDKISGTVDFELPECLVESDIRYNIDNLNQNLLRIGSNLEKAGLKEEKLREEFRPLSRKRVKDLLILGEIARQNDLIISDQEVEEGFKEISAAMGQEPEALRRFYEARSLLEPFKEKLLEEKTLNYLAKSARVKEIGGIQGQAAS